MNTQQENEMGIFVSQKTAKLYIEQEATTEMSAISPNKCEPIDDIIWHFICHLVCVCVHERVFVCLHRMKKAVAKQ